ncbi:glucosaminidase domain-containing protein [Chitinophaga japonensis]|uniref:Peptidoglycan hydrolase n=1 Tax=Chitinophaga japonensis TaxID=104662 RepID=A0A562TAS8_CHIJA|nr:glucosaminidase domain-containing protein [Chitinophaga japonensis]TWI90702.1 flagellum-specific peptidoglycan hydrolase FlgJ [Chitinophaga japonensis]
MQLRKSLLVVSFLIGCMPVLKAQTMTTQQYIATYKDIAIEEMRRSGVPAAIKLAQGILETQSGNGWLVLHSNNHFGIKCKNNWIGETVNYDDDARQECFRKYPSAMDSYRDHSTFLRNNPRYAFLFEFAPDDYKSWAYGLKQAGYATSRIYPQQLIKIIEDNHLEQYTQEGLGAPRNTSLAVSRDNTRPEDQRPPAVTRPAARPVKTAARRPDAAKVFEINGRKVLYLPKGTALIQVADRHNIRLSRLLKYNDLSTDAPLPADMYIYLQKKSKKGKDDYHVVAQGESLHDVAQAEGIQMKWLRRRNRMQEGEEPAPGEKLALDGYSNRTPRLVKGATPRTDEDNYSLTPEGQGITKQTDAPAQTAPAPAPAQPAAAPQQSSGIPVAMVEDLKKVAQVKPAGGGPQAATPQPDTTPAAQPAPAPAGNPAAADRITGILQYHDVQPKETAYGISKRYHITIEQLLRWNNLPTTDLKIGQRLLVGK